MLKYETPNVMVGDLVVYRSNRDGIETYTQGTIIHAKTAPHSSGLFHEWIYTINSGEENFDYPEVPQFDVVEKLAKINYIQNG